LSDTITIRLTRPQARVLLDAAREISLDDDAWNMTPEKFEQLRQAENAIRKAFRLEPLIERKNR